MNFKHRREALAVCALLGMTVLAAGCGSSSNSIPPIATGTGTQPVVPGSYPTVHCTGGGYYAIGDYCIPATSLATACANYHNYAGGSNYGVMATSSLCKTTRQLSLVPAILNPDNPYGAYSTGSVRTHDKIRFVTGSNGYWGHNGSCSSWGPFNFCTSGGTCTSDQSITNPTASYEGYPEGMLAAVVDGSGNTDLFAVPTSTAHEITNGGGTLYTGMNVPSSNQNGHLCAAGSAALEVTRCEDGAGNTSACP